MSNSLNDALYDSDSHRFMEYVEYLKGKFIGKYKHSPKYLKFPFCLRWVLERNIDYSDYIKVDGKKSFCGLIVCYSYGISSVKELEVF